MKLVNMHEMVWSKDLIAFPGLGNCHGIVYATTGGMFGWHLAGVAMPDYYTELRKFITKNSHSIGVEPICILGACPTNRGTNKQELKDFARAIGYKGKVEIYKWDIEAKGWTSTYVLVTRMSSEISVAIAEFNQDNEKRGANPSGFGEHAVIKKFAKHTDQGMVVGAKATAVADIVLSYDNKADLLTIAPTEVMHV